MGMIEKFSDQLRRAVRESEATRYALSKTTGISQAVLCRFVAGTAGMSLDSIDRLMDALNLEIRPRKRKAK
jgi:predicted transcriptional regulator